MDEMKAGDKAKIRRYVPQMRKDYERGWRYSKRETATLDHLDRTGASDAMYDGYMDYAMDRPKWHSLICDAGKTGSHGQGNCTLPDR